MRFISIFMPTSLDDDDGDSDGGGGGGGRMTWRQQYNEMQFMPFILWSSILCLARTMEQSFESLINMQFILHVFSFEVKIATE